MDAYAPAVVSITHVEAGNTWNVVPDTARLEGTVRTLDESVRREIKAQLDRQVKAVAAVYGCPSELNYTDGPAPVINDAALCDIAVTVALEQGLKVARQENSMGGEDFSAYQALCSGAFIRIGTGGQHPNHHPAFTADPAALWPTARYCAFLARKWLNSIPVNDSCHTPQ